MAIPTGRRALYVCSQGTVFCGRRNPFNDNGLQM